jgi:hypothetical protein
MMALSAIVALLLFAIAALHAYWGFGGVWPGTDAASCAKTIAGFRGANTMPGPGASLAVTAALAVAALIALVRGGWILPPLPGALFALGAIGAALVFLGRGIAGFTPAWRRLTPEQPFARLDVRYYSPLCLLIGLALLLLALKGFV